jgi:hypothetical protein
MSGEAPHGLVRIPVEPEQVRPEIANNSVLGVCRNKFDDRQPIADDIMITRGKHRPDLKGGSTTPTPAPGVDLPRSVHLEVGVQGELIAKAEQLMFAARDYLTYPDTSQICRGKDGHPELRPGQNAVRKHLIQPLAGPPDGVSLGHGLIVPSRRKPRQPGSSAARIITETTVRVSATTRNIRRL